jgi:hypothetical protein
MQIKYLEAALDDMIWFREYYSKVFSAGKQTARTQLLKTELLIAESPSVGEADEQVSNVREYPIPGIPFTVLFRLTPESIEFLRIYDQRSGFSNDRKR